MKGLFQLWLWCQAAFPLMRAGGLLVVLRVTGTRLSFSGISRVKLDMVEINVRWAGCIVSPVLLYVKSSVGLLYAMCTNVVLWGSMGQWGDTQGNQRVPVKSKGQWFNERVKRDTIQSERRQRQN